MGILDVAAALALERISVVREKLPCLGHMVMRGKHKDQGVIVQNCHQI